jgi:predicted transcriptional regulator
MLNKIAPKTFKVQTAIFYNDKLKYTDKIIYIYLCAMAIDNKVIISIREIAQKCNCAKQSVHNSLKRLVKNKFITVERRHLKGMYRDGYVNLTSIYTILDAEFEYTDVKEIMFKQAKDAGLLNMPQVEGLASHSDEKGV